MAKTDPQVDQHIEKLAEFARPIPKHLRRAVHAGCSEVEETIKWGISAFRVQEDSVQHGGV